MRKIVLLTSALALTFTGSTLNATAETTGASATTTSIATPQPPALNTDDVTAQTNCSGTINGHPAGWICEYGVTFGSWASGRGHNFLVGTDHRVWNQIQHDDGSWSAWASLGGGSVVTNVAFLRYSTGLLIMAQGQPDLMCRWITYATADWGAWHTC